MPLIIVSVTDTIQLKSCIQHWNMTLNHIHILVHLGDCIKSLILVNYSLCSEIKITQVFYIPLDNIHLVSLVKANYRIIIWFYITSWYVTLFLLWWYGYTNKYILNIKGRIVECSMNPSSLEVILNTDIFNIHNVLSNLLMRIINMLHSVYLLAAQVKWFLVTFYNTTLKTGSDFGINNIEEIAMSAKYFLKKNFVGEVLNFWNCYFFICKFINASRFLSWRAEQSWKYMIFLNTCKSWWIIHPV